MREAVIERRIDPWQAGVLPSDWRWCGGCGAPSRVLTSTEIRTFTGWIAIRAGHGDDAELLDAIAWPIEMYQRSRPNTWAPNGRVCSCRPRRPEVPSKGCHLYRLWSADGRLLYVGVSTNLRARIRAHRKRWGDLIARVTYDEHPDERSMLAAEAAAIRDEDPALNKAIAR